VIDFMQDQKGNSYKSEAGKRCLWRNQGAVPDQKNQPQKKLEIPSHEKSCQNLGLLQKIYVLEVVPNSFLFLRFQPIF